METVRRGQLPRQLSLSVLFSLRQRTQAEEESSRRALQGRRARYANRGLMRRWCEGEHRFECGKEVGHDWGLRQIAWREDPHVHRRATKERIARPRYQQLPLWNWAREQAICATEESDQGWEPGEFTSMNVEVQYESPSIKTGGCQGLRTGANRWD